jgi:Dyggve-Melchior-Clausen syndrome protein
LFADISDKSVLSDALSDAAVLEEVLRMILEIVNSCLVSQIKNNPNLVKLGFGISLTPPPHTHTHKKKIAV